MSIILPSRRLAHSARVACSQHSALQPSVLSTDLICTALRDVTLRPNCVRAYASKTLHAPKNQAPKSQTETHELPPTPFTQDYLKRKPNLRRKAAIEPNNEAKANATKSTKGRESPSVPPAQQMPERGRLASSSIFADDDPADPIESTSDSLPTTRTPTRQRNPEALAATLIPRPWARARWQRKKVIQSIRKRGRLNKAQMLLRTERFSLSKSHFLKTSVKKLGPLARQIAGKSIDDAILQMRFSKKKAAKEVLKHLEHARDVAIVKKGLGLGEKIPDHLRPADEIKGTGHTAGAFPREIRLKDGQRYTVTSPHDIYVSQAWVGRGTYGRELDYRARGQGFLLRPPFTSITILLKEEKTRLREAKEREEREEKKRREKMWVQLPDKSIPGQRQFYSW